MKKSTEPKGIQNACSAYLDESPTPENKEKVNKIKKIYILELFNIKKYIQNEYIYKMFLCYAFVMHGKIIDLDSNN